MKQKLSVLSGEARALCEELKAISARAEAISVRLGELAVSFNDQSEDFEPHEGTYDDIEVEGLEIELNEPEILELSSSATDVCEPPAHADRKDNPTVAPKRVILDEYAQKMPWMNALPASRVNDVRSAITLNDRVSFINGLFGGDPQAFQDFMLQVNSMSGIDEVLEYISAKGFSWDMDSDIVYSLMMAVRRKLG